MFPVQLPVPGGYLFLVLHLPSEGVKHKGWVLHVPAFAEEMNKSRVMVAHQSRELAKVGYSVVIPDLTGCGDSTGELAEVNWARWREDINAILAWIVEQGGRNVSLWGLRLGCLLALQVARANVGSVHQLLLWQPIISAHRYFTHFMRLQMAAGLLAGDGESTRSLRGKLEAGLTVEVAGYELSPGLVMGADSLTAESLLPPLGCQVQWLEIASADEGALPQTSQVVIDAWSEGGAAVQTGVVPGEPFWAVQERALAPALIERTSSIYRQLASSCCSSLNPPLRDWQLSWGGEVPIVFDCSGDELLGVYHGVDLDVNTGVLVIVGGPQYRVGSHRQFVSLARSLATNGVPVFRFDYRGMGDSVGAFSGYLDIEQDIRAAINVFLELNSSIKRIVLWGLCDAATAATFYAPSDERVVGLVLANPWVWSERGEAKTYLRNYYARRLLSGDFWNKVLGGRFNVVTSLAELIGNMRRAVGRGGSVRGEESLIEARGRSGQLAERMYQCLDSTSIPLLLMLSGRDLTAAQFRGAIRESPGWQRLLKAQRTTVRELSDADHTFSRGMWRDQVSTWTEEWVRGCHQ